MAILLFTGVDKSGKSTLMNEVLKTTNRHICVDRFTACQYVYGELKNKVDTPEIFELRKLEAWMSVAPIPAFFVYVSAETHIIAKRFKEHNETDIHVSQIVKVKEGYTKYLQNSPLRVININTSRLSVEEATDLIIQTADLFEKQIKIQRDVSRVFDYLGHWEC